jgi:RHS repeat-associated protein
VETNYSVAVTGSQLGTVVTVKDQALKERRSITNELGQLTRVDEPDNYGNLGSISSPTQPTYYSYDTLNNLTQVQQTGVNSEQCGGSVSYCQQTRSFQYDSLSRLKQATNPESGTISYVYDNNGNLTSKTDARNITTTYGYDNLNRVKTRTYSGESGYTTPNASYFYDNLTNAKGKLIKVTNGFSMTEYTEFDILGRVKKSKQTTDNTAYPEMLYSYNLSGALLEQTYPSGRVVKNTFDNDGQLMQVQSRKLNDTFKNYANSFNYTAAGAVSAMRLGNGKWENTVFNARLQPTQIGLGSSATDTGLLKLNYDYGTTDNNGNVKSQQITVPTVGTNPGFTAVQSYTYDSLNRLQSAVETIGGGQTWKQTYTFDRYGNRRFDEANTTTIAAGCPTAVCNPQIDPTNNRLIGSTFDNAGNTTANPNSQILVYDAENKQVQVSGTTGLIGQYFYDGDGKRVKKYVPSTGETTIFVYDASGKMVAEYSTVVAAPADAKTSYLTNDHLGSPMITTDSAGKVISRRDFLPFGEEIQSGTGGRNSAQGYGGQDNIRQKFTGYERDAETDLDFAQARMYHKNHGRFTSPDPLLSSGRVENPQTWNRYAYVLNSPLKYTDPFGMYICDGNKKQCKQIEEGINKAQDALKKLDPKSDQYKALERALKTYGAAGVDNGVTIKFGENKSGSPAATVMGIRDLDGDGKKDVTPDNPTGRDITVTFDTKQHKNTTDYAINIAHEGSHVADGTAFIAALPLNLADPAATEMFSNSPLNLTKYETETRAYGVSAAVAQGLGIDSLKIGKDGGNQYEIWNSGWKQADRLTKQSKGIDKVLAEPKSKGGLYEITKDKPGVKLF